MKLSKIALLITAMTSGGVMANDIVTLKFSDARKDVKGIKAVNAVLNPIGVNVTTIEIPEAAKPILRASESRALTKEEHAFLIKEFNLTQEQLLEQIKLAGRTPAVKGGGVLTEETGFGPYPKVYDMLSLDKETHKGVLEKYGRMHVNSAEDGTDVDEVMTVVSGGPFRWGFTLKDGSIARFQVEKVGLNDKAVRVSYHGLGMHAGIMDAKQGLIVAFVHGPQEFTMRYKANVPLPHAKLLGTNPWIDFSGNCPVVLDKVKH